MAETSRALANQSSGSMEPAFYRGDILFLSNPPNTPYDIGDITVYKMCADFCLTSTSEPLMISPGDDIPIVHRVIESHTTLVAS